MGSRRPGGRARRLTAACSSDPVPATAPSVPGTSTTSNRRLRGGHHRSCADGRLDLGENPDPGHRCRLRADGSRAAVRRFARGAPGRLPGRLVHRSTSPGELGPAIIAGHVDWDGPPGVFFALRDLTPGAEIAVEREDGSTALFRVESVEQFPKGDFPTDAVYADIDHAGLRLITAVGPSTDRRAATATTSSSSPRSAAVAPAGGGSVALKPTVDQRQRLCSASRATAIDAATRKSSRGSGTVTV